MRNIASGYGGVAYILVSSVFEFVDCNLLSSGSNYGGGAIFTETSTLSVSSTSIASSTGDIGGAIHAIGSVVNIEYSSFDLNGLVTYTAGAIYVSAHSRLVSMYSNYTSNRVSYK